MPLSSIRWNLKQLAIFIAILAVSFATIGIGPTVVGLAACTPTLFAKPGRKLASLYWMMTCYPILALLSLYVTWFAAWLALGHPPRPALDDPKQISSIEMPAMLTALFFFGTPFAMVFTLVLMVLRVAENSRTEKPCLTRSSLCLPIPLIYVACYGFFCLDPFGVWFWFLD